jgi:hypothetical protein
MFFLTRLTNSSPRAYALALFLDPTTLNGMLDKAGFFNAAIWDHALGGFTQMAAKYGEDTITKAAERLLPLEKDSDGRIIDDPKRLPLSAWLDALIKNSKAELPEGHLARFHASSYDPKWVGHQVRVRGTVARVEMIRGQSPVYAVLHFKESPSDAIVAYTPNYDEFQAIYGRELSALVGRPLEVWGGVTDWRGTSGVRILGNDQVKLLDEASVLNFADSKPAWLTAAASSAVARVESPKYAAWKKFAPGTTIAYSNRILAETAPGSGQYTRKTTSRDVCRLASLDTQSAVVSCRTTSWDVYGKASSSEQQIVYRAMDPAPAASPAAPNASGDETLVISGKSYNTHWNTVLKPHTTVDQAPDADTFTRTWMSDDVPGGVVLQHQQSYTDIAGKPFHTIIETIVAPVENVEPELATRSAKGTPSERTQAPTSQTPAAAPAPIPAPTPPPANTASSAAARAGRAGATGLSQADVAQQREFATQFSALQIRAVRVRQRMIQLLRTKRPETMPNDVQAASDRLENEVRLAGQALSTRDSGAIRERLRDLDDTLSVLERYLAK